MGLRVLAPVPRAAGRQAVLQAPALEVWEALAWVHPTAIKGLGSWEAPPNVTTLEVTGPGRASGPTPQKSV